MAKRRKKRRDHWGPFLLFWTLLLLTLGLVSCLVYYRYASVYEDTMPEKAMDELMAAMSEDGWRDALLPTVGEVGEFEDPQQLFESYFNGALEGRKLSYRLDRTKSTPDQSIFGLYAGPSRLGEVRLVPVEGSRISFLAKKWSRCEWRVESIRATPLTEALEALTVEIDVPDGTEIFLNGKPLRQELIIDPAVPLSEVGELEARFERQPRMVRYEITPLYGDITVTDAEGNEIAPLGEIENGRCRYVVEPKETYSFEIEAPEGVVVTVCGAELGEGEIVSSENNMFRHLENYITDSWYKTVHYAADGLYSVPEIRATYNGEELTPVVGVNGKYFFFYPSDPDTTWVMRSAADEFFKSYMNYTSYKYNGTAMVDLLNRTLSGTDLYRNISTSRDAMIWASATEVKYDELKISNFHFVRDDCFSCSINYKADYTATSWHGQQSRTEQDGYKMLFVQRGGRWLAASMTAFEN